MWVEPWEMVACLIIIAITMVGGPLMQLLVAVAQKRRLKKREEQKEALLDAAWLEGEFDLFKSRLAKALKAAGVKDKYSIALEVFRDEYWPNRPKTGEGFEWWLKEELKKGGK